MAKQLNIFDRPAKFQMQDTSLDAAKAISRVRLSELRRAVLNALRDVDLTSDEIAARTGIPLLTVRPRLTELKAEGYIEPTAIRRNKGIVWHLKLATTTTA